MEVARSSLEQSLVEGPLERPAMARSLGGFYMAGATLGLAALALPGRPGANVAGLAALDLTAWAIGALLFLGAHRLPGFVVPLFLAVGTLLTSGAVYFDGHATSAYGLCYVAVGLLSFYFLPRGHAFAQLALAGAAFAAVLTEVPHVQPFQLWIMTMGTAAIGGVVVLYMSERVRDLVARLTDAARTDSLTGLLNRRAIEELFELELERARRSGRPLSIIVGDLDGFKAVNDRLGHHAGDAALQTLADELGRWKRRIDMAARLGGEEFALLLPETDERGAFLVAERLRRATHRTFADGPLPLTISFGVATFPDHGDDADTLLRAADQALYAAKDLGKDRSVIFSAELAQRVREVGDAEEPDLGELRLAAVISLAEALDIRDTGTAAHAQAVARYAHMMAEELGLDPEHAERVRLAGILHDVGKVALTNGVLTKPGPLDAEEWSEMRTHPEIAAQLLSRAEFADLREWVLSHHERVDGTGYPRGLEGDRIPVEARILAVADAYEAMTADRVYRPALGDQAARVELVAGSGAQFDGEVVQAFLNALDRQAKGELDAPEPTVTK
jgi:diguanylate cyclase (GGDEF)-like protein/putative nucleotidyltransferase with HDIG domain